MPAASLADSPMTKPTFAVVGTQKAATTWLFECLDAHPEVFVPDVKEVHYFCPPGDCRFSRRDRGAAWYAAQFSDGPYRAWGELTTDYMFFPQVAGELHAHNPEMRIVFMLRDPVDRAYSAYWMRRRHKADLAPFREMLDEAPGYIERGRYFQQIEPYVEAFGRHRVRVYIYEEAMADKTAFIADLYGFIGADPSFRPPTLERNVGGSRVLPGWAGFVVYKVVSPVINLPGVRPLWRWLRDRADPGGRLLRLLGRDGGEAGYPAMAAEDRAYLADVFRQENRRLFEFLGRDIPAWTR